MSEVTEVLIARRGHLGHITLDRPRAINALTFDMVRRVTDALTDWADDDAVQVVAIDGAGDRGFCAGADIKTLRDAILSGDDLGDRFFEAEYRMNALIAAYPKRIVTFMDGIVMGGGIGLSAHGSDRLVTERSRIAMPEVGIGFFPDVGATWLLSRAPGELGTHLALTGDPIDGASAITCGLADSQVASNAWPSILEALRTADPDEVLADHAIASAGTASAIEMERPWIDAAYAHDDVREILDALDARPEDAAHAAAASIRTRSPLSLTVTLRALREARSHPSLDAALARELQLARAFLCTDDYVEGVRAAVVDKDRNPSWKPSSLEAVTPELLAPFFP